MRVTGSMRRIGVREERGISTLSVARTQDRKPVLLRRIEPVWANHRQRLARGALAIFATSRSSATAG